MIRNIEIDITGCAHLLQSCNKSVSWYLGYRTFLEENPDIFKKLSLMLMLIFTQFNSR